MRIIIASLLSYLLSQGMLYAQKDGSDYYKLKDIRKNSIYLEILGNGAVYSFNYDRLVVLSTGYRFQGRKGLVFRATPMYIYNSEMGDTFGNALWFGISIGFSF